LADGTSLEALRGAALRHAAQCRAFALDLDLGVLAGFVALLPRQRSEALHRLADSCVEAFDRFRAPPIPDERERRRAKGLSPAEERNLERWGYPYVFREFRFHMTLSQRLEADEARRLIDALGPRFRPVLAGPVAVDAISLFAEECPGAPFCELERFPLGGA
jgi:hypothetical protein